MFEKLKNTTYKESQFFKINNYNTMFLFFLLFFPFPMTN